MIKVIEFAKDEKGENMFTKDFLEQINGGFEAQMQRIGKKRALVEAVMAQSTEAEAEAMQCLYAGMPVSDAADYEPELLQQFAKHGVYLWEEGPFAGKIPEDVFAGYVLLHRVNNEDITFNRRLFHDQLIDKIQGMTMEEAAIYVNYWCASQVTYQGTDMRTRGAETVYKSAYGRCGEETVFAISVCRSLGIPARQIYVPLWTHCDSNHAWMEVWVDGTWKFLGACEPEEILNKGWFTNASSRAMMAHSRWYLPVAPRDAIVGNDGMALALNHLDTYAHTMEFKVMVQDVEGNPVPGAKIVFEVMNFSKMGEIATVYADEKGQGLLHTGKASVHVTAFGKAPDGSDAYGELLVNTQEQSSCVIVVGDKEPLDQWTDLNIIVAKDDPKHPCNQTEEEIERGRAKFAEATALRLQKVADFYNEETAEKAINGLAEKLNEGLTEEDKDCLRDIMKKACGNMSEIVDFLGCDTKGMWPESWKLAILKSLRMKDYTDIKADVLAAHCLETAAYEGTLEDDIFFSYVLCPRVESEYIHAYRAFIKEWFTEEQKAAFKADPQVVWKLMQETLIADPSLEYSYIATSAKGALTTGYGSHLTKKIISAQILRTLGVPARLNPADGMLEAWQDGGFVSLEKKEDTTAERSAAIIVEGEKGVEWRSFENWTIARFEKDGYKTLRLGRGFQCEVFGEIALFPGKYRVLTANRLPNGNILAKKMVFELKDGEKKPIFLEQRKASLSDMLEEYDVPDYALRREDQSKVYISELVKEQKAVMIWLEESKEPTEHVLNEIRDKSREYSNLPDAKLYFVIKTEAAKADPTLTRTLAELSGVTFLYDEFGMDRETLARRMYVDTGKLPLIVVVNQDVKGIYSSAGYNVGNVDMVLRILNECK